MKKIYIVRHHIEAKSIKEAIRLSKEREPDDCWISEDWLNKVGFVSCSPVEGFKNKK